MSVSVCENPTEESRTLVGVGVPKRTKGTGVEGDSDQKRAGREGRQGVEGRRKTSVRPRSGAHLTEPKLPVPPKYVCPGNTPGHTRGSGPVQGMSGLGRDGEWTTRWNPFRELERLPLLTTGLVPSPE